MRILDPVGAEVLVLGDNASVGGYAVDVYDEGDRSFRRIETDSPFVHGTFPITETLDGRSVILSVLVTGPDWATVAGIGIFTIIFASSFRSVFASSIQFRWINDSNNSKWESYD